MDTKLTRRQVMLLSMIILIPTLILAKDTPVLSHWQEGGIKIDGVLTDWPEIPSHIDSKTKVDVIFLNDGEDLYIRLLFTDPKFLSSIQFTGLKIRLGTQQMKNKKIGFHFLPKKIAAAEMIERYENTQGPLSEAQKNAIHQKAPFTVFEGQPIDRKDRPVTLTPLEEGFRPSTFRHIRSHNSLGFEIRLPLNAGEIYPSPELTDPLHIGFEWGGTTKEMREAMMRKRAEGASQATQGATRFETRGDDSDEAPVVGETRMGFQRGTLKHAFQVTLSLAKR
jgi:hypothetical protein